MDYDEIYAALGTIRIVCNEMQEKGGCIDCPMSSDKGKICNVVQNNPSDWDLIPPTIKLMG